MKMVYNKKVGITPYAGGQLVLVSKNDEFCIKNDEFCIRNEKFCIKNEELCI